MLTATLAADGFVVLRDVLDAEQLRQLRLECDALCAAVAAEGANIAGEGCVVEVFRHTRPAPSAAARTDPGAYAAARREALASQCAGVVAEPRSTAVVELALFHSLPCAVLGALGADATLYCFNEQYVVKPARSECTFAWHRDAQEQLALCTDLDGRGAGGKGATPPYFSVWAPLDDCTVYNGTLVVLPGLDEPLESEQAAAAAADTRGVALDVPAGGACVFSSELWHASGGNRSAAPRRVFYAQYSTAPIVSTNDGTPLSFAVPVGGARTQT